MPSTTSRRWWLIDTSALLRYFVLDDPLQEAVDGAVLRILDQSDTICFTPQVARETWAVLTRPRDVGGYGQTPQASADLIANTGKVFVFREDVPEIYSTWLDLVRTHNVSGKQVHDAYHVAAMLAHGLSHVLTLDERDFARYPEITVVKPSYA